MIPVTDYVRHIEEHFRAFEEVIQVELQLPKNEEELTRTKYVPRSATVECTFCLEAFKADDPLIYLPCLHYFHEVCLLKWFHRQTSDHPICPICPVCQKPVFKPTSS